MANSKNPFPEEEYIFKDGTVAHYGKANFRCSRRPDRELWTFYWNPEEVWIVDPGLINRYYLEILGHEGPDFSQRDWPAASWTCIRSLDYDKNGRFGNSSNWTIAVDVDFDRGERPPNYKAVIARKVKLEDAQDNRHWIWKALDALAGNKPKSFK